MTGVKASEEKHGGLSSAALSHAAYFRLLLAPHDTQSAVETVYVVVNVSKRDFKIDLVMTVLMVEEDNEGKGNTLHRVNLVTRSFNLRY